MAGKSEQAFRTIGELAEDLGIPQHILRYWETRFPQLKPLQRAGNRRYYRPSDVALARRIHRLLNEEGYTIRGVQRVLEQPQEETPPAEARPAPPAAALKDSERNNLADELAALRALLAGALADSRL